MAVQPPFCIAAAILVLCLLFAASQGVPLVIQDKCNVGCNGVSSPLDGFLPGNVYTYSVDGDVKISVPGGEKGETKMQLSAVVQVNGLGNCGALLKVTSLQIQSPDNQKYGMFPEMSLPVRFTMQDGVLGSDICVEEKDSQRSINIKRAILSLLQTATQHNTEVDIFGVCPTTFTVQRSASGTTVRKAKDLNLCAHREQAKQDLIHYIYNPNSDIKDSFILLSKMTVDSQLKNGVPEKVESNEDYLYRPFSQGNTGAKATANTKLILKQTEKGALNGAKCTHPRSIIFERSHMTNTERSNVANLVQALLATTKTLETNTDPKSAASFVQLIRVMRASSKSDLMSVFGQIKSGQAVKDNNLAKRVFLDALFRAGSGDSVEVSIKLLQSKELTPLQQKLVYVALATAKHATTDAIKSVAALLDDPKIPNEVFLGAGALAGAFCREHSCHGAASRDPGVAALTAKFSAKLGNCRTDSKKSEDTVVAVLKGIRNIHHIEDAIVNRLVVCASDQNVRQRVRVAALEAFSGDACIDKLKKTALEILGDRNQDSEVRIKAYLALLECPCAKVANAVREIMTNEPVYQVGSFIASSVRNIRASANPDRENLKQHFAAIEPKSKFWSLDARKYSKNYEVSYEYGALGIGSVADSNVIFSQDSFLPRSLNLNLTAEVFGRRMNILEVGVRQGNLDRILEEIFGPRGTLNTGTPQQIFSKLRDSGKGVFEHFMKRLEQTRTKRDLNKQTNDFGNKLKTYQHGYSGNLDLDMFMKMFGSEMVFLSLGEDESSLEQMIDNAFDFVDSKVNDAKQFSHEVRAHMMYLDSELAYPTSTGMELKLNLQGGITSKVGFSGSFDIKQIMADPMKTKFDLKIVPSANIEITGSLSVDADFVAAGVKVVGSLQTSTGAHINFKLLQNGDGFELLSDKPVDKQEIITATSDVFLYVRQKGHQDIESEVKFDTSSWLQFSDCFDPLSEFTGVSLCADLTDPWRGKGNRNTDTAAPPLNGPLRFKIHMETDWKKGLYMKALLNNKEEKRNTWELTLQADGQEPRKLSVKVDIINRPDLRSFSMMTKLRSSVFGVDMSLTNNQQEKSVAAGYTLNDRNTLVKLGIKSKGKQGSATVYEPVLIVKIPDFDEVTGDLNAVGTISVETVKGRSIIKIKDVTLNMESNLLMTVRGEADYLNPVDFDSKLGIQMERGSFSVVANILPIDEHSQSAKFELTDSETPDNNFRLTALAKKEIIGKDKGDVAGNFDLQMVTGANFDDKQKTMDYSFGFKNLGDDEASFKTKFTYPRAEAKFSFEGKSTPKLLDIDMEGELGKRKGEFELFRQADDKIDGNVKAKMLVKLNDKGFKVEGKREVTTPDKSKVDVELDMYPGGKYSVKGTVNHKNQDNDVDAGVSLVVKAPNHKDLKIDAGVVCNLKVFNMYERVVLGPTEYLDFVAKVNHGDSPTGVLKLNYKDFIQTQGQFKMSPDNSGNANLMVELMKAKRKIKMDSTFKVADPQYNVDMDIFYNFEKDNQQKINFKTDSKLSKNNVDTKNSLTVDGHKTDLNVKCDIDSNPDAGKASSSVFLALPDGKSLTLKTNADKTGSTEKLRMLQNEFVAMIVTKKDGKPFKYTYKGKMVRDDDVFNGAYEVNEQHTFVRDNGEDLDIKYSLKNTPGDKTEVSGKVDVTGAMINNHLNLVSSANYDDDELIYKVKGTYGQKTSVDAHGKFLLTNVPEGPSKFESDFEGKFTLPLEKASNIRISSKDSVFMPSDSLSGSSMKSIVINSKEWKVQSDFEQSRNTFNTKVTLNTPQQKEPLMFAAALKRSNSTTGEGANYDSELQLDYGKGKLGLVGNHYFVPKKLANMKYALTLPDNFKYKKITMDFNGKCDNDCSSTTNLAVDLDGQKHTMTSQIEMCKPGNSLIEIKTTCPDRKPSRVYIKSDKVGDKNVRGIAKMENLPNDFNLDMDVQAMLDGPDNYNVKVDVDCPKLHLNKVHLETTNESSGKQPKKITFFATEGGNNILSGVTTYQYRQEGTKFIMEGQGNVKVKDEAKTTSFKYIRNKQTDGADPGVEVFFNVVLADKNIVVEYKRTLMEYKLNSVFCEEKKQCAHVDINNKVDTTGGKLSHNLQFGLDMRKLGLPTEFGLESKTEMERFKLPVHNMDFHFSQDKSKYHTQVYAKPVNGVYQSAFIVTTPQRIMSMETSTTYTEELRPKFPWVHETVIYADKSRHPEKKTMLKMSADFKREEKKQVMVAGDVIFTTPAMEKSLQLSGTSTYLISNHNLVGKMIIDVFAKKNQKIQVDFTYAPSIDSKMIGYKLNADVVGKGLGFETHLKDELTLSTDKFLQSTTFMVTVDKKNNEYSTFVSLDKQNQKLKVKIPGNEVVSYESKLDGLNKFEGKMVLLQEKPVIFKVERSSEPIKVVASVSVGNKGQGIVLTGQIDPKSVTEVRADALDGGKKKPLANAGLRLSNNMLKPETSFNSENIKDIAKKFNAEFQSFVKKGKQVSTSQSESVTKDLKRAVENLRNAAPDFKSMGSTYEKEFHAIIKELEQDKAFQQMSEETKKTIKAIAKVIDDITQTLIGHFNQANELFTETYNNMLQLFNERILPELTSLYEKLVGAAFDVAEAIVNIATHYFVVVTEFIEKQAVDFKPLMDEITGIFKDLNVVVTQKYQELLKELEELWNSIKEHSDVFNLKELWNNFASVEVVGQLQAWAQQTDNPDLKELLNTLAQFLTDQSSDKPSDAAPYLKKAFDILVKIFNSYYGEMAQLLKKEMSSESKDSFFKIYPPMLPALGTVSGIPNLMSSPVFSVWNHLKNEDWPSIAELYREYMPKSIDPRSWIPPYKMVGWIVGGQHIFTFDSRHLTFPGSCQYVAAQDAVDKNFTVVVTMDKGQPKAVALVDKSGNAMEVNIKGELTLNNAPYGFPVIKSDTIAWRNERSFTLMTLYGVHVQCDLGLEICSVRVSGYYLGKLRGLLGDGNNEPFDDFRLPNGKISTSESEFGNAYALTSNCQPVRTVDHSHHEGHGKSQKSSSACSKVLNNDSPNLMLCAAMLDMKNYRQACQHATASAGERAQAEACLIARAYVAACRKAGLFAMEPEECGACHVDGASYPYNNKFFTKLPSKQADIFLAVETTKNNEKTFKELAVPLISQIVDELKAKKMDDVKVYLVGVSPTMPYPIFYDTQNNKMKGAKIDFKDESRLDTWQSPITTENPKMDTYLKRMAATLQKVLVELGLDNMMLTLRTASNFQWRPKAAKTVIMVNSDECPHAISILLQTTSLVMTTEPLDNQGVSMHLIAPIEDLVVPGAKNQAHVVGFNEKHVFVIGDKKRGLSHANLRDKLEYDTDFCHEYTEQTGGNVYSTEKFFALPADKRKPFLQMASHTIVDSLTAVHMNNECECASVYPWLQPQVTCTLINKEDKRGGARKK